MRPIEAILGDVHNVANVYPAGSGHFVYTGDKHGDGYVDYRPLGKEKSNHQLLYEVCVSLLGKTIYEANFEPRKKIIVLGPETMGAIMMDLLKQSHESGWLPTSVSNISFRSIPKDPADSKKFKWGIAPPNNLPEARTILMDDLLNFSTTFHKIEPMVRARGGKIDAVATIGNRCNVTAEQLGVRSIVSLEQFPGFTVHEPGICSQRMAKMPIVRKPGHGHNFEKDYPDYQGGFVDTPTDYA